QYLLCNSLAALLLSFPTRRSSDLFVAYTCRLWQIPCKIINVDVDAYRTAHKTGTQLAARELRYEAFRELMEQDNIDYLAFGHHRSEEHTSELQSRFDLVCRHLLEK